MVFQVLGKKPPYVLELPSPRVLSLPSLLNGCLHDSGLPYVALLRDFRAGQYTAQEQRHIEGLCHARPPM